MQVIVLINNLILFMILAWSSTLLAAEDWLVLNPQEKNVFIAIDQSSVVQNSGKVIFWERVEFERPEEKDEVSGRMIKYKRVQRVMDCAAKTQGVLRGSTFGENNKLIEAIILDAEKIEMRPIMEGSVGQLQFDMMCKQSKN
ncbi:MAG: hypothetical protein RL020_757 [Pseudomonadota bacterium]|jgi:hypothetical protein